MPVGWEKDTLRYVGSATLDGGNLQGEGNSQAPCLSVIRNTDVLAIVCENTSLVTCQTDHGSLVCPAMEAAHVHDTCLRPSGKCATPPQTAERTGCLGTWRG